ncbi:MAG: glycosyltransferase family 4 protein [Planctomycetales bacterium]|nr:glycosyltransferase family 4 protein [Planctomycetales bacterium]MCA9175972.1 glycosyltransferase family 4 protein [Planctomycetales bacterium]
MRILYFHQHFTTPRGACGTRSYEFAKRMVAAGHQVTIVCGSHDTGDTGLSGDYVRGVRRGEVDGIDIIELNLPYGNQLGFVRRAWTFLRFSMRAVRVALTEKYDIVFATTTPLTVGVPGILARWLRRKPFVFEVRDLWPELPKAMGVTRNPIVLGLMSLLEWSSYRSADRLVALSPGIREGILRRGVSPERVAMIPNASDCELFREPSGGPWRPESISPDSKLVVFTGTHGVANGLEAVLDAAAELKRRGRDDIAVLLVGKGGRKAALVERATREGLDNVVFHDPIPKTRIASLLASADAGLQVLANVPAFYYGTSPNKFFDYCAAGIPIVCNYPGWVADLIGEQQAGIAVPPESPEALATAIERICDDRDLNAASRQGARRLADSQFNRELLATQFVSWVIDGRLADERGSSERRRAA